MAKAMMRNTKALERRRFDAIRRLAAGETPKEVAEHLGVKRAQVYEWHSKAARKGLSALRRKNRPGRPTILNERQMRWLRDVLETRIPHDMGMRGQHWKLPQVQNLIRDYFGIELSNTTVWRYVRKLGLIPNLPRETGYVRKE